MQNMQLAKIIENKRNGKILDRDEISYFVQSVVGTTKGNQENQEITDRCQIGAMLMAIYLKGLNSFETVVLTEEMQKSGHVFEWPLQYQPLVVDKHSTGGVGDKVSLVLTPALAALGLKVPMISGRSLAHTGGTIDKLESIPGFQTNYPTCTIEKAINTVGCCIVAQSPDVNPADKILYHCRELTATVDYPPLIIASIVSKKLSEGLHSIVYDVKFGRGSMFKTKEEAFQTAKNLVDASRNIKASAVFTSMENPLGNAIGDSLEVLEAVECLKGGGPTDVLQIVSALGAELLLSTNKADNLKAGQKMISEVLVNGKALEKFHELCRFQGVSEEVANQLCYGNARHVLDKTNYQTDIIYSGEEGYITAMDPLVLANVWRDEYCSANKFHGIGFNLIKTVGEEIKSGQAFLRFHHQRELTEDKKNQLSNVVTVSSNKSERILLCKRLFYNEKVIIQDY